MGPDKIPYMGCIHILLFRIHKHTTNIHLYLRIRDLISIINKIKYNNFHQYNIIFILIFSDFGNVYKCSEYRFPYMFQYHLLLYILLHNRMLCCYQFFVK